MESFGQELSVNTLVYILNTSNCFGKISNEVYLCKGTHFPVNKEKLKIPRLLHEDSNYEVLLFECHTLKEIHKLELSKRKVIRTRNRPKSPFKEDLKKNWVI